MSKRINPKIYMLTTCGLMAALMCIFGPLSVPIGPIPVSLTNLILYFAVIVIGTRNTTISYVVYLLLGIVGLPVFSGFQGGIAKVAGPTGGYLVGFIPMVLIAGWLYSYAKGKFGIVIAVLGMMLGTAIAYLLGTIWFVMQMECEIGYALSVCVYPFIPFDIAKMIIAYFVGLAVRKAIVKAGFIE